jgi:hypothetical protein
VDDRPRSGSVVLTKNNIHEKMENFGGIGLYGGLGEFLKKFSKIWKNRPKMYGVDGIS